MSEFLSFLRLNNVLLRVSVYIYIYIYIYTHTQLSVAEHLECHILDIMNNAARNMEAVVGHRCTNISVRPCFQFFGYKPISRIAGLDGNSMLIF